MFKASAAAGIVGPVVFTGAWIASSLLQTGYSPADIQISGLAAPDATDPWIMITGFLLLGGCTVAFGGALHEALAEPKAAAVSHTPRGHEDRVSAETPCDHNDRAFAQTSTGQKESVSAETTPRNQKRRVFGQPFRGQKDSVSAEASAEPAELAPRLIQGAGVLTMAAGLLRRDHLLLVPGAVSWHNHVHDAVSAVLYVDLVLAQVLLWRRFDRERAWKPWRPWLLASAVATATILIAFAADTSGPGAGILQRVAVTIPLAVITAIAARLLRIPATAG